MAKVKEKHKAAATSIPESITATTTKMMPRLPIEVLSLIVRHALADQHQPAWKLLVLNSNWHAAAASVMYESLTLYDEDALLLLASEPEDGASASAERTPRLIGKLRAICGADPVYAKSVRSLRVIPARTHLGRGHPVPMSDAVQPATIEGANATEDLHDSLSTYPDPLDDDALHTLIRTRLSGLVELSWEALRTPPEVVVEALDGLKKLSAWGLHSLDKQSSAEAWHPRWDASCLTYLPPKTVTTLRLQNLSAEGVRVLQTSLQSLPFLEEISFEDTIFVDDALIAVVAEVCTRLRILRICRMAGTKLTNKGIHALMEHAQDLEHLELEDCEGRLTKKCWSEVPVYPPSFRSFKFAYSETSTTHHSWTFDHLQSVISLLEKAENLETISITRIVPHAAQLPFQHDKIDMAAQMMPKPLPDGLLPALFRHKQSLRALELDFWECSFERTKAILETCLNLQKLSVIFDAPFAKLLTMTSTFLITTKLQHIKVHVPLKHTPGLSDTSITMAPSIGGAVGFNTPSSPIVDDNVNQGLPRGYSRARQGSLASISSMSSLSTIGSPSLSTAPGLAFSPTLPRSVMPLSRDVKKLVKKTANLLSIEWLGRGACGIWEITRGGKEASISFIPINEMADSSGSTGSQDSFDILTLQENQQENGDTSSSSFSASFGSMKRRQRASTSTSYSSLSSFASTFSSEDVPPVPPLPMFEGLGLGMQGMKISAEPWQDGEDVPKTPTSPSTQMTGRDKFALPSAVTAHPLPVPSKTTVARKRTRSKPPAVPTIPQESKPKESVKIVHGGGWISKRVKGSSSSSNGHSDKNHSRGSTRSATQLNKENLDLATKAASSEQAAPLPPKPSSAEPKGDSKKTSSQANHGRKKTSSTAALSSAATSSTTASTEVAQNSRSSLDKHKRGDSIDNTARTQRQVVGLTKATQQTNESQSQVLAGGNAAGNDRKTGRERRKK